MFLMLIKSKRYLGIDVTVSLIPEHEALALGWDEGKNGTKLQGDGGVSSWLEGAPSLGHGCLDHPENCPSRAWAPGFPRSSTVPVFQGIVLLGKSKPTLWEKRRQAEPLLSQLRGYGWL